MTRETVNGRISTLVKTESGAYDISAQVTEMGADLLVAIWGGEQPHIGAVAMAEPRPSLKDAAVRSATASVFTYLGHKEDELVKHVSETLARKLDRKVVVAAGIHWDDLPPDGIEQVLTNSGVLVTLIIDLLQ